MGHDLDGIVEEIRAAADAYLTPRFRTLRPDEVREKSPGELVTVADQECEIHLNQVLRAAIPGSTVVGEEAASRDPRLFGLLSRREPVWLLDPLDGTSAFANGSPDYAVMVALLVGGETVLAVIHQPEYGRTFVAEQGSGAYEFETGTRLTVRSRAQDEPLHGGVMKRFLPPRERDTVARNERNFPSLQPQTTTAGIEYPAIARGDNDFMLRTLPWDHAPGVLLLRESGGTATHLNGRTYQPKNQTNGLLIAHSPELWGQARVALGI